MRIGRLGCVQIECSPLFILLLAACLLWEDPRGLVSAFLALSLHEASHSLVARALGYEVLAIELQPFGFVARLRGGAMNRWDELAIAAAGPLFSLTCGAVCRLLMQSAWSPGIAAFAGANLMIGCVNLLPALPLDGGRMLGALLGLLLRSKHKGARFCAVIGVALGAALLALGIVGLLFFQGNPTLGIMGLFLLTAAIRELKHAKGAAVQATLSAYESLRRGREIPVRTVALHRLTSVEQALRLAEAGKYTLFIALDDDMKRLGQFDQTDLQGFAAQRGSGALIHEMFRLD